MEIIGNIKIPKNHGHRFVCEHCDYVTSHLGDWNKHLSTDKHKKRVTAVISPHNCACGKTFTRADSLYRHKKTCRHLEITIQKIKKSQNCFQMFPNVV